MYGGMRGIRGLVTETSLLDPEEVRGHLLLGNQTLSLLLFAGNPFPWLQHPRVAGTVAKGAGRGGATSRGNILFNAHWANT